MRLTHPVLGCSPPRPSRTRPLPGRLVGVACLALAAALMIAPQAPGQEAVSPKFDLPKGADVVQLAFAPGGRTLASLGRDDRGACVRLWDVKTGKETAKLPCRYGSVWWLLAFTEDGKSLVASCKRSPGKAVIAPDKVTIEVWDLETKKVRLTIDTDYSGDIGAVTPDSKTLVVGGMKAALYDLTTGKKVASLEGHDPVRRLAVSRDGKWLATASDGKADSTVKVWDLAKRKVVQTLKGHSGEVTALAFSADGKSVASAADGDRMVLVWDRAEGTLKHSLDLNRYISKVTGMAFTPDDKTVVIAANALGLGLYLWEPTAKTLAGDLKPPRVGGSSSHGAFAMAADGKTFATFVTRDDGRALRLWATRPLKPVGKAP